MTRTVNTLEEGGYVARRPHDTDGRQVLVSLSEQGRDHPGAPTAPAATPGSPAGWPTLTPEQRAVLRQAAPILDDLSRKD